LFQSVQEQLAENRKARQHRHGAVYLLQGLTVCGHCHYAYYGKKVSKAAAKDQRRDYAYYRCIGTDAYRFGGERVCDNQQIRTDRLDELVWQQVVELLAHPGRLKSEYERRLGVLEEKAQTNPDTAALERQRLQLDKGKSRLIDSYAEGMIDKTDFDPKMRNLKSRLEQLDQQIQESRRHQVGQRELFLVINRLEEFAAAVHNRLGTVDFVTKREIIRGLVKRVEIHKDEILVVFRIDPDPGFNASESSTGSDIEEKSMQDRTRRNHTPLRYPSSPFLKQPRLTLHRRLQPASTVQDHSFRHLVMFQSRDDQVVPNVVEERADIHFQYPVLTTAPNGTLTQSIVGRSSGPVPIRVRMENRIDHSLHIFSLRLGLPDQRPLGCQGCVPCHYLSECAFPVQIAGIRP
jgi:hypothetical protein